MSIVSWSLDIWGDLASGMRVWLDAETNTYEFALICSREYAQEQGLMGVAQTSSISGQNPKATNLKKLDPEDEVMIWGGLLDHDKLREFAARLTAMMALPEFREVRKGMPRDSGDPQ